VRYRSLTSSPWRCGTARELADSEWISPMAGLGVAVVQVMNAAIETNWQVAAAHAKACKTP